MIDHVRSQKAPLEQSQVRTFTSYKHATCCWFTHLRAKLAWRILWHVPSTSEGFREMSLCREIILHGTLCFKCVKSLLLQIWKMIIFSVSVSLRFTLKMSLTGMMKIILSATWHVFVYWVLKIQCDLRCLMQSTSARGRASLSVWLLVTISILHDPSLPSVVFSNLVTTASS